ncbi:MAG TPA: hypothetical protein VKR32_20170 [Puia sp.]|nr:hypothetical protein [Puia sp.]
MTKKKKKVWGDPEYGPKDDIYSHGKKVEPGDETTEKVKGLDVPGGDLDDRDEKIGEEDEENNYYSLGGDDHNDLDEKEDNEAP